jgi:hypothetical protein
LQGSAFIGGRYIEFDRTDKTTHATEGEDPFAIFRDISQISRMWGPQGGISVDNRPAPGGGITYGGKRSNLVPRREQFGQSGVVRADPRGGGEIAPPEFSTGDRRGGLSRLPIRLGRQFRMFADLMHMRELPYFAGGEVGIDTNDLTEFIWGGRFVWRPSYFHYHRPRVEY